MVDTALLDGILRNVGRAVHHIRQDESMPVHGGALGQVVSDVDSYPLALSETERRSGDLTIERIPVDRDAGKDRPANHRCLEIEDFHAVLDTGREDSRTA